MRRGVSTVKRYVPNKFYTALFQCNCKLHHSVQWLEDRASDSQLREPGLEPCAKCAAVFSFNIAAVHSAE